MRCLAVASMMVLCFAATAMGDVDKQQLYDLIDQEIENLNNAFTVCHEDSELIRKASISFKANLQETRPDKKCMVMQLNAEEISKLEAFGFDIAPATDWIEKRREELEALKLKPLEQRPVTPQSAGETPSIGAAVESIPGYSCYETVEGTFSAAQSIVDNYPDLATWFDIGDSWEKENGIGGYDMMVLKLTNNAVDGPKPILFINSAIHAREYATTPLVLHFADYLVSNYGTEADATWILDYHEIHILLHTNPDGRKFAETGLMWRKNTNQNYCGTTSNNRGADLNRNFTFGWNSADGSSGDECEETFRGPYAASEPETQAMEDYLRSIFPDNRGPGSTDAAPDDTSGIHLDIHSYGELILWPWGTTSTPAPNGIQLQTLGRKFAYWNSYSPEQAIGLYPTDGTTEGISYGELGIPSYTFELGTKFFQSCSSYAGTIIPDNMPALIYAAKVVRTPYVTPSGPNTDDVILGPATVMPGSAVTLSAVASDARFNNSNGTESTQSITAAQYYIDIPPWESDATPIDMSALDGDFNSTTEEIHTIIDTTGWELGSHTIFVRSQDTSGVWGAVSAEFLTISNDPPPPTYCDAQGDNVNYSWIAGVNVGRLNHPSDASGYSDFTATVVDLEQGAHHVELSPGFAGFRFTQYWKIYIDLNQDGIFATSEAVYSATSSSAVSGTLTIPETSTPGETRMRVMMKYNGTPDACESFGYGEVEDYTVNIVEGGGTSPSDFFYENRNPVSIPDRSSITSTIDVPQDARPIDTVTVSVTATHEDLGDLSIVASKDGSSFTIKSPSYFDNSEGTATYTATIDLSGVGSATGTWTLRVSDNYYRDTGTLDQWSLSQ